MATRVKCEVPWPALTIAPIPGTPGRQQGQSGVWRNPELPSPS